MIKPQVSQKATKFLRTVSPVREIMSYADPEFIRSFGREPEELISFAGGWVNHEAPALLRQAYREIATDSQLFHQCGAYSPTRGSPEGKQAIIAWEEHLFGMQGLQPSQVVVGANSTQMTFAVMQALLDPGDTLLTLDPAYCNYPVQALTVLDVELASFPVLDPESWTWAADERIDAFRQTILEKKPKVVLLVSPDNPTSQVPSDAFVQAALESVEEIGGFLVVDFAYKTLVFDEADVPEYYAWTPRDNYLSLHSNSKWSKNLGRRMGWLEAPEAVCDALESILSSTILCPDSLHQLAFARFLERAIAQDALKPYVAETRVRYRRAAQVTTRAIREHLGLPCLDPRGGLYTCVRVDEDGARFVEKVLEATGVLFVPGWGFGRSMRKAVRASYGPLVNDLEKITAGMARVGTLLGGPASP